MEISAPSVSVKTEPDNEEDIGIDVEVEVQEHVNTHRISLEDVHEFESMLGLSLEEVKEDIKQEQVIEEVVPLEKETFQEKESLQVEQAEETVIDSNTEIDESKVIHEEDTTEPMTEVVTEPTTKVDTEDTLQVDTEIPLPQQVNPLPDLTLLSQQMEESLTDTETVSYPNITPKVEAKREEKEQEETIEEEQEEHIQEEVLATATITTSSIISSPILEDITDKDQLVEEKACLNQTVVQLQKEEVQEEEQVQQVQDPLLPPKTVVQLPPNLDTARIILKDEVQHRTRLLEKWFSSEKLSEKQLEEDLFYKLLLLYKKAEISLHKVYKKLAKTAQQIEACTNLCWTFKEHSLTKKSVCPDANSVQHTFRWETADVDEKAVQKLKNLLQSAKKLRTDSATEKKYEIVALKKSVEELLFHCLESLSSLSHLKARQYLNSLFRVAKGCDITLETDKTVLKSIGKWLRFLLFQLSKFSNSADSHFLLLNVLSLNSETVDFLGLGPFLQTSFSSGSNNCLDQLSMLSALLKDGHSDEVLIVELLKGFMEELVKLSDAPLFEAVELLTDAISDCERKMFLTLQTLLVDLVVFLCSKGGRPLERDRMLLKACFCLLKLSSFHSKLQSIPLQLLSEGASFYLFSSIFHFSMQFTEITLKVFEEPPSLEEWEQGVALDLSSRANFSQTLRNNPHLFLFLQNLLFSHQKVACFGALEFAHLLFFADFPENSEIGKGKLSAVLSRLVSSNACLVSPILSALEDGLDLPNTCQQALSLISKLDLTNWQPHPGDFRLIQKSLEGSSSSQSVAKLLLEWLLTSDFNESDLTFPQAARNMSILEILLESKLQMKHTHHSEISNLTPQWWTETVAKCRIRNNLGDFPLEAGADLLRLVQVGASPENANLDSDFVAVDPIFLFASQLIEKYSTVAEFGTECWSRMLTLEAPYSSLLPVLLRQTLPHVLARDPLGILTLPFFRALDQAELSEETDALVSDLVALVDKQGASPGLIWFLLTESISQSLNPWTSSSRSLRRVELVLSKCLSSSSQFVIDRFSKDQLSDFSHYSKPIALCPFLQFEIVYNYSLRKSNLWFSQNSSAEDSPKISLLWAIALLKVPPSSLSLPLYLNMFTAAIASQSPKGVIFGYSSLPKQTLKDVIRYLKNCPIGVEMVATTLELLQSLDSELESIEGLEWAKERYKFVPSVEFPSRQFLDYPSHNDTRVDSTKTSGGRASNRPWKEYSFPSVPELKRAERKEICAIEEISKEEFDQTKALEILGKAADSFAERRNLHTKLDTEFVEKVYFLYRNSGKQSKQTVPCEKSDKCSKACEFLHYHLEQAMDFAARNELQAISQLVQTCDETPELFYFLWQSIESIRKLGKECNKTNSADICSSWTKS